MNALPFVDINDHELFMREYWQKAPCVFKANLPESAQLAPDELAGIAAEPSSDARLVQTPVKKKKDWRVANGPFCAQDYDILGPTHWTLLVRGVDQYIESAPEIFNQFNFLPAWRREDLMVSFAANKGSVGAHTDFYDVFIIQGEGQRRWRIGEPVAADAELIANIDQKVLAQFDPTHEVILSEGDAIYIPPMVPHEGISIGQSMSYSVGYRAPSLSEAIDQWADIVHDTAQPTQRYSDEGAKPTEKTNRISQSDRFRMVQLLDQAKVNAERILGELMTQPVIVQEQADTSPITMGELSEMLLDPTIEIGPAAHTRMAYYTDEQSMQVFCNGSTHLLANAEESLIDALCSCSALDGPLIAEVTNNNELKALLLEWINKGHWGPYEV